MTNEELSFAIAFAFEKCSLSYIGGYTTSNTEPGKVMLEHLKQLLALQVERATNTPTPPLPESRHD